MEGKHPVSQSRGSYRRIMMMNPADFRHEHDFIQFLMDDIEMEEFDVIVENDRRADLYDARGGR